MGSTAAVASPASLLALLRQLGASTGAVPPAPGLLSKGRTEDQLRALAILAQLRDAGQTAASNRTRGTTIPDPMKTVPNLLKLPGLFADLRLSPAEEHRRG
jgi:hypothetical protein